MIFYIFKVGGNTKKSLPKVSTRSLRKKKLKKARQPATVTINRETQLVVETIHTSSSVDVVWQVKQKHHYSEFQISHLSCKCKYFERFYMCQFYRMDLSRRTC